MPANRPRRPKQEAQVVGLQTDTPDSTERAITDIVDELARLRRRVIALENAETTVIGAGEVNTASNVGSGAGVFQSKVLADLQFKSLVAGTNVTITPSGTELLIAATGSSGVPTTRLVNTTAPLTGGGDLSADRTLGVDLFNAGAGGIVTPSGGGTVNFLRADGTWTLPAAFLNSIFTGFALEGSLTFDGVSTVAGFTPTAGVYTINRDLSCANLTVDGGATLQVNSWRLFANGTATINGTLRNNGSDGGAAAGGAGAVAGFYSAGGAGGATAGIGPAQVNGFQVGAIAGFGTSTANNGGPGINSPGLIGDVRFRGGGGGGRSVGGGTQGGAYTVHGSTNGYLDVLAVLQAHPAANTTKYVPSSGGGGGAPTSGNGGGGGGGGGVMFLSCQRLAGSGVIQANGGNGGTPTAAQSGAPGGGGGGLVCVMYGTRTGSVTMTASGGLGGPGAGGGGNGGPGADGLVLLINMTGDGT